VPERAHVTSVEAIESFRADLILYTSKARPALEEIAADVLRTRLWLQNEQRTHWENMVRRRMRELEQAQQALALVRFSCLGQSSIMEQKAVQKARLALEEAEAKLQRLKQWNREFDSRVEPLVKQLGKLQTILANDMLKATASLAQTIDTLHAYSETDPSLTPPPADTPSGPGPSDPLGASPENGGAPGTGPDAASASGTSRS